MEKVVTYNWVRHLICLVVGGMLMTMVFTEQTADAQRIPAARTTPKAASETITLWTNAAPGDATTLEPEKDTTGRDANGKPTDDIIRLGNVSAPTLAVYRPAKNKANGAAVLVCPGGGYHILAMNLEGTEICQWLNDLGYTAFLLKYRVPRREGRAKHDAPLQDAQRAMGIIRARAADWNVDPKRIGILGFSAGGHLSVMTCTQTDKRTYDKVDEADIQSPRPDFALLIYPAYLTDEKDLTRLAPEITVTPNTPPTFLVITQDDPVHVENAFVYAQALQKSKVPFQLHIYPKGGHGYGMRPTKTGVETWTKRAEEWLTESNWHKSTTP
jgi:acetyl esterase/lipase